jgi:hypothetical protein
MKFRTIDIEGDCNTTINKRLFPEGNHFDPDTIIWCVTFCDQDYNTLTLVKKLPPDTRVINGVTGKGRTSSYHERRTVIPTEIDGHVIKEFTEWKEFLCQITREIMYSNGPYVYSKGYGKYNYDAMVLKANMERNDLHDTASQFIKCISPSVWEETYRQVKKKDYVPNQKFTENGIRHNIEDAIQLAKRINNKEVIV